MAFNVSAGNLWEEAVSGTALVEHHLTTIRKNIVDYTGRHYRDDRKPSAPVPDPHNFKWIAQFTDQVVYNNPRFEVNSRAIGGGVKSEWMARIKHGMNRWAEEVDSWWTYLRLWYDCAFGFGICRVGMEPIPGFYPDDMGRTVQRPKMERISPRNYTQDPRSGKNPRRPRFAGEKFIRDRDDLINDPRFNSEAIRQISPDTDSKQEVGEDSTGFEMVPRKQISGYEIWVPEKTLDDYEGVDYRGNPEYHGTIYTIGVESRPDGGDGKKSEAKWLRDPYPYFGPECGPYELFGLYLVPDQVYPLSPLAATRAQVLEYNAHLDAAARAARRQKRFVAVDPAHGADHARCTTTSTVVTSSFR